MITEQTPILGAPSALAEQVVAAILARPHACYADHEIRSLIVPAYYGLCAQAGVDPALAIAQLVHETDNLTSFWSARPQRNPAGIGVTGERRRLPPHPRAGWAFNAQRRAWERGLSFPSWEEHAIPAHVGRLLAYALRPDQATAGQRALIDRALAYRPLPARFWGSAPVLRQLGKRHNPAGAGWASPGDQYGARIARIAQLFAETPAPAPVFAELPQLAPVLGAGSGARGLAELPLLDLRASLPRKSWSIGRRKSRPTSITLHYNGPPVARRTRDGELAQLVADARWQMRPGGLGAPDGGDGLQYHFVVLGDGTVCQTRDIDDLLWHCAHPEGNRMSLAVHLPLGGDQDATPQQWEATGRLFDALIAALGLEGRQRVFGHQEWSDSQCPGPHLMRRLRAWRAEGRQAAPCYYRVRYDDTNVRQGPGTGYPVAQVVQPGHVFACDATVQGQSICGESAWLHRADELGFVHLSCVAPVEPLEAPPAPLGGAGQGAAPRPQRCVALFDGLQVHAAPFVESAVVATLAQGEIVAVAALVDGEQVGAGCAWASLADRPGFVPADLLAAGA